MYLLLLTLTAGILLYVIRCMYRRTCGHINLNKTALKMKILAGSKSINLLIQMFIRKPDSYLIRPPSKQPTLQITGFCSPLLAVNWNNATVIEEETDQNFPFPPLIQIETLTGFIIRYMIRDNHSITLYWEFNQQRYHIPNHSASHNIEEAGRNCP